jgi:opacity protein-like surface antigen
MKKALMGAMLLMGTACAVSAQEENAAPLRTNAAASFSDSSASQVTLFSASDNGNLVLTSPAADASAEPTPPPLPAAPAAKPKYVFFGDRDDYRWQLGVGLEYVRFQSNVFDASMVGLNTTLTYFTNTWFAVEGSVITGFGSDVYPNARAKIFGGAGGIRIGGRRARWEPFGHALVGGSHLQPQTADGGRNSLMAQAGGGVDFRVHSRLSLRGEGDWIYTTYFSQNQNNFQVVAGVVLHF